MKNNFENNGKKCLGIILNLYLNLFNKFFYYFQKELMKINK